MRLNKYVALATGLSRRSADAIIAEQRVRVNDQFGQLGQEVHPDDKITIDGKALDLPEQPITIMLNKPAGYVCSRDGQGSKTIYDLLPAEYYQLKPVGRLDKDSSGLLLLTNDGDLAHQLTHPSFQKQKIYEVELDQDLRLDDFTTITKTGVKLEDGMSKLGLDCIDDSPKHWRVDMHEGRNRQIRRTFEALGYKVRKLHRLNFGPYKLDNLASGKYRELSV